MSVHVFALSVVSLGNIHIDQDCSSAWYCQLEEHQAEMKNGLKEQYMEA